MNQPSRLALSFALSLAALTAPQLVAPTQNVAHAQSAADKATARQLATEGIKLYRDKKYAEALDRVQRAQKLYDAPPHLLYIARSQVALGQLVEGAETYRTLARRELPAGSPAAFTQAVDEGKQELSELEPKIPAVRIDVKPAGTSGLDIRIDDERVPAEVVGVDRPINPGKHRIQVSAPGFHPSAQDVEIRAGERLAVNLQLEPASGAPPPLVTTGPAPPPTGAQQPQQQPVKDAPAPGAQPAEPGKIGFMLGLRLAGAVPTGDLVKDEPMKDTFEPGGGFELHGGLRFARYFTAKLMFGAYGFKAGPDAAPPDQFESDNVASATTGGIGFQVGTPRGKFGGFGELNILFHHQFQVVNAISSPLDCEVTGTYRGSALSVGGGLSIPLSPSWHLTPFLSAQWGQFDELEIDEDCGIGGNGKHDIDEDDRGTHGLLLLGVGGEFLFGPDKPLK